MPVGDIRRAIAGFPHPDGYDLRVIPLRYRGDKPHLSAWTDFEEKAITIQIPEPFLPFGEIVPYGGQATPGQGMRFIWLTEGVTFRSAREALRFLYLHEWMHWYLKERATEVAGGDRVRPLRAAQLPQADGDAGGRREALRRRRD